MKKTFYTAVIAIGLCMAAAPFTYSQKTGADAVYDKYVQLLRADLRATKKEFIAKNVVLTPVEASKFWTIYDRYTAEQMKIYDGRIAVIQEYAAKYDNLSDADAANLTRRSTAIDQYLTALRLKYVPLVAKVLPGRKSAIFFQLDKRIELLMDLQIASLIPLVD